MIRRHVALLKSALMLADGTSAFLLFGIMASLRFDYLDAAAAWGQLDVQPAQLAVAYSILWVASLWVLGLYRIRTHWSLRGEVRAVLRATALVAVASLSALFLLKLDDVSRLFLLMLWTAQPFVTVASRFAMRVFLGWARSRGHNGRRMLIVGTGPEADAFADEVERHRELGLRVVGHLSGPRDDVPAVRRAVIGTVDSLEEVLHRNVVDEVAVCLSAEDWAYVEPVARICEEEGRIVRVSLRALGGGPGVGHHIGRGHSEELGGTPIVTFLHGPDRVLGMVAKRMFDILISLVALLVLSPIVAAVAGYIRVKDGSPVLFRQDRVGLHGRTFTCLKFRTMSPDAEERLGEVAQLSEVRGPQFKVTDDPRITATGRLLRKTSLDELPQLINVLRGEMSIVGPRPALVREVAEYSVWHRRRLSMRPGITGLWQVEARSDADFDRRASLDLDYIDRWSLWMDLKIMVRTIPAILLQEGR